MKIRPFYLISEKTKEETDLLAETNTPLVLNLKQQRFIGCYIDPESPTYGNATRSYMLAYGAKYETAVTNGSRLLRNARVREALRREMEKMDLGIDVRLGTIADIIKGMYITESQTKYVGQNGEGKGTAITRTTPKPSEVIKAVELANKITGGL